MIERHIARYNWKTGKWEWGEPPKHREATVMDAVKIVLGFDK